MTKKFLEL